MTKADLSTIIWEALKRQACVNPKTAARIVVLHKHDVDKAVRETPELFELCSTSIKQMEFNEHPGFGPEADPDRDYEGENTFGPD